MIFTKIQGAGNDFVLVDTGESRNDWSKLAVAMCDRHYGVGADGLLLLLPSKQADFKMRVFNADGSESSACGNGLRCMVKHFMDSKQDKANIDEITVETNAGIRRARIHHTNGKIAQIQTGMGQPGIGRDNILIKAEDKAEDKAESAIDIISAMSHTLNVSVKKMEINLISMGNPHAVYFWNEPVADFPLAEIGPQVERHTDFSEGTNYEVANVKNRGLIEARVWERGVGETLACGSGACAICVAAYLKGYTERKVDVQLPGGILNVEWNGSGEVFLSGPAETVFVGDWSR